ncbi:MAG: hypothetical protein RSE41_09845, partial [Clostridia bacterium]
MRKYEIIESGMENKVLVKWTSESNKEWKEFSVHTLSLQNNLIWGHYFTNFMDANVYFNQYRFKSEILNEYCSLCDGESEVKNDFKIQRCTECGELILPCQICVMDEVNCGSDCPLNNIKKYELETYDGITFKVLEYEVKKYKNMDIEEFLDNYTYDDSKFLADRLGIEL